MRIEIRIKNQETKTSFKEIAASFPTQEDALKELIRVYKLPGRTVIPKLPGGLSCP
jgi:hypothetical protein